MDASTIITEACFLSLPVILLLVGIFTLAKKLNPARPVWAYLFLILTPFWLWMSPVGILGAFVGYGTSTTPMLLTVLHRVVGFVYLFEVFLVPYLLVKTIRSSAAPHTVDTAEAERHANAKRQLQYGAVAMLTFGVVCVLPAFLYIFYLISGAVDFVAQLATGENLLQDGATILLSALVLALFMLVTPYGWVLSTALFLISFVIFWVAIVGFVFALALALNGLIRYLSLTKPFPKARLAYILLLFVPLVNVVVLFRFSSRVPRFAGGTGQALDTIR